jgi:hypothetical protein
MNVDTPTRSAGRRMNPTRRSCDFCDTIRNNYFHNEAWSRSRGNRTLYLNGRDPITGHNVIEGNRFGYAARPCDDFTAASVLMATRNNLF